MAHPGLTYKNTARGSLHEKHTPWPIRPWACTQEQRVSLSNEWTVVKLQSKRVQSSQSYHRIMFLPQAWYHFRHFLIQHRYVLDDQIKAVNVQTDRLKFLQHGTTYIHACRHTCTCTHNVTHTHKQEWDQSLVRLSIHMRGQVWLKLDL